MRISLFLVLAVIATSAVTLSASPGKNPEKQKFVYAPYRVMSSERDSTLDTNHAVFVIRFPASLLNDQPDPLIEYSCNGVVRRFQLTPAQTETGIEVSPGEYTFQFYAGEHYQEIVTRPVTIAPGHRTVIALSFMRSVFQKTPHNDDQIEQVLKPVIYLYPEKDLAVDVQLRPEGAFTFTYPAYDSGWKGTAHPDGSMSIAGKNYPYLFWEAEDAHVPQLADYSTGFVVKRGEVVAFLEEKLSEMNLSDKEKTDFITFWGPRMAGAELGFVQFVFNKDYDAIATLDIRPAPKQVFRVYMLWTPLEPGTALQPEPQLIQRADRTGFYVIEWGGSALSPELFTQRR
jgi:hypothetical protein